MREQKPGDNAPPCSDPQSDLSSKPSAEIIISSLFKHYDLDSGRALEVLKGISFEIPQGQFVSIVGPSGCGKSTLLNIFAGLQSATSGAVLVDGKEVSGPGRDRGMVFQEDAILPWRKVRKNIEYGLELQHIPKKDRQRISDIYIDLVRLTGFADVLPKELSGGMKKRVAIAMVLANEPKILLMDEPFGSLDYATKVNLQNVLLDLLEKKQRTTVFVTHDIEEAVFLSDRVVVLRDGHIEDDIPIDLARPRQDDMRTTPSFQELKERIWSYIAGDSDSLSLPEAG